MTSLSAVLLVSAASHIRHIADLEHALGMQGLGLYRKGLSRVVPLAEMVAGLAGIGSLVLTNTTFRAFLAAAVPALLLVYMAYLGWLSSRSYTGPCGCPGRSGVALKDSARVSTSLAIFGAGFAIASLVPMPSTFYWPALLLPAGTIAGYLILRLPAANAAARW